jgi:hypothetical protein
VAADGDPVTIQLSRDEALALLEWLHRFEDQDGVSPPEHHAEQVALWTLSPSSNANWSRPFSSTTASWLRRRGSAFPAMDRLTCGMSDSRVFATDW